MSPAQAFLSFVQEKDVMRKTVEGQVGGGLEVLIQPICQQIMKNITDTMWELVLVKPVM